LLDGKRIVVTGGTGSLGIVLVRRLLSGGLGQPEQITVFSRDEAKQHAMRLAYQHRTKATDEVIYRNFESALRFQIGDVRDYAAVTTVLRDADIVFNEAVLTNIMGAQNIVRAIRDYRLPIETVVGISTDKATKPVNVMGMTKAIQERIFVRATLDCDDTRFVCARYGNVLASRGSVIPLFLDQIRQGGPVTITTVEMTRFLLSLEQAVDTVLVALRDGGPGETYVPRVASARVVDIASVLIGDREIETVVTGIRPGEKVHEILVSEEESHRAFERGDHYVIAPILPELQPAGGVSGTLEQEFSSADALLSSAEVADLFREHDLLRDDLFALETEEALASPAAPLFGDTM
jgi:UDP-glucose 4-epimerase